MEQEILSIKMGEVILLSKHVVLVKHTHGDVLTLEDMMDAVQYSSQLSKGNDYVLILDGLLAPDVEDNAMNFIANHLNDQWKAFAIIVRNLSDKLLANYYLFFIKPSRPTKAFATIQEAEKWLKEYVEIDSPIQYSI
jgi:hypothetical protein